MKRYTIYTRKKNNTNFFYVVFVDDDTGKQINAKSVEVLRKQLGETDRHHISKRSEAEYIVQKAIEKGLDGNEQVKDPLFLDYLKSFWNYDKSYYIKKENKKRPNSIGRDYSYNRFRNVDNHVAEYIPKDLRCSQLKKRHLEKIQEDLVNNYSVSIWQSTLKTLSVPIKELLRKGVLVQNPLFDLDVYPTDNNSSVGILTEREKDKLIFQMYKDVCEGHIIKVKARGKSGRVIKNPDGTPLLKDQLFKLDYRIYLATCLASVSGMRRGEILGLHKENIRFPNSSDNAESQAIIDVMEAYARKQGMKCPKGRKVREVPIPGWLAEDLLKLAEKNPWGNGFVFYSDISPIHPYDGSTVYKWFLFELQEIGISNEERIQRHIVFHSFRHYFNTRGISEIGGEKTRMIMGHTSERMTDRYDNGSDQRILEIGEITSKDLEQNDFIPDLIVVDTLSRFMEGNENMQQDANSFIDGCDQLASRFNCCVLFVHHVGVCSEAQGRARGSSVFRADVDCEYQVENKAKGELTISQTKIKDGDYQEPLFFNFKKVALENWYDEDQEQMFSSILIPCDHPTNTKSARQVNQEQLVLNAFKKYGMIQGNGIFITRENLKSYISGKWPIDKTGKGGFAVSVYPLCV